MVGLRKIGAALFGLLLAAGPAVAQLPAKTPKPPPHWPTREGDTGEYASQDYR